MRIPYWALMTFAIAAPCAAQTPNQGTPANIAGRAALTQTITELDTDFFGTFNSCETPEQLDKHGSFLDAKLEFYHDNGGVTWTKKDYIDRTRANVCGRFVRKLTAGSIEVYPVKDFGAIEEGEQDFCEVKSGKCFGSAKFMLVWHQTPGGWFITRAFSYGHHAIGGAGDHQ
ncbi:MAG: nuclear transport factor 2 family protein [Luteibacter sp.]